MEKKKATKVGCQSCKDSITVKKLQNFVFIFGGLVLFFSILGLISIIKFFINLI